MRTKMPRRLSHWIIELVTLVNAACGMIAIFFLVKFVITRSVSGASPLVYLTLVWSVGTLGAIFDYLDGALARWMKMGTELGKELDSLCDAVTFGVLPAMIIALLNSFGSNLYWQIFSWVCAVTYLWCALFRLARFDVITSPLAKHRFQYLGMPTPTAAGMFGAALLLHVSLHDESIMLVGILWRVFSEGAVIRFSDCLITVLPFLGLLLAYLMVSDLEFVHFDAVLDFFKKNPLAWFFFFLGSLFIVILLREMLLLAVPLFFLFHGLVVYFYRKITGRKP